MLIEDTLIQRYYHVSFLFAVFSLVEGVTYWFHFITFVNLVYLIFEIIWLFFTLVMFFYMLVNQFPIQTLLLPLWYFLYFVVSLSYLVVYLMYSAVIPQEIFVRYNALLILIFAIFSIFLYYYIHKRYFQSFTFDA